MDLDQGRPVLLGLLFFILITMVVIPSFWMYFAEQKLGWGGPSGGLRDLAARSSSATRSPWASPPGRSIVDLVIVGAIMQNWRRKLRGATGDRPTGGYR